MSSSATPKPAPACVHCGAALIEGKRFCADCGAPTASDLHEYIREQVGKHIREHYRSEHTVEIEVAESVASRLQSWARLFAWAVAFPVALFLGGLTFFGVEKIRDINQVSSRVDREVRPKIEAAVKDAAVASQSASQAKAAAQETLSETTKELASVKGYTSKVEELSAKVSRLEQQSTTNFAVASKRIESRVSEIDDKVDKASAQIAEQQKKLTDTGELVKSLFANSRIDIFDGKDGLETDKLVVREGKDRRIVYMLLTAIPVPGSVRLQYHIFSQPPNSFGILGDSNIVVFMWGDPAESLKQHQISVAYVADPTAKAKPFSKLSVRNGHVYADNDEIPDIK